MTDIQLPPLPGPDFLLKWQNHESRYTVSKPNIGSTDVYTADRMQAYARAAIEAEKLHTDKLLLASVPGRWKSCASSVGAVQSYIAELEAAIEAHEARKASQWRSAAQNALIWMESAWERIDGEWGPCGKTLDQLCAEGEEPEIEALRSLLASAQPAPQASKKPLFGELIAQHEGLAEELKTIDAEVDRQHGQASVVKHASVEHGKGGTGVVSGVTATPVREPLTPEQEAIINFLLGASDLENVWFGDRHPQEKGAFWWRERLRRAFQQAAHGIIKDTP